MLKKKFRKYALPNKRELFIPLTREVTLITLEMVLEEQMKKERKENNKNKENGKSEKTQKNDQFDKINKLDKIDKQLDSIRSINSAASEEISHTDKKKID